MKSKAPLATLVWTELPKFILSDIYIQLLLENCTSSPVKAGQRGMRAKQTWTIFNMWEIHPHFWLLNTANRICSGNYFSITSSTSTLKSYDLLNDFSEPAKLCHTFSPDFCCYCQLSFVCRCSSVQRPISNSDSVKHTNRFPSTAHVLHLEGGSRWLINLNFRASMSSSNPSLSRHEVFVVTLGKNTTGHFSQKQFVYRLHIRPLKESEQLLCQSMTVHCH